MEAREHLRGTIVAQRKELGEKEESISRNLDKLIHLEVEIEEKESA